MLDPDLVTLRQQAERGDQDAVDQLVELAGERGDLDELRKLADRGSSDAVDILVELAGERGDPSSTPWPAGCMELTWRSRILASDVRSLTQLPGSAPGSAPAKAAAIRSR